jgi:hypothetical protein
VTRTVVGLFGTSDELHTYRDQDGWWVELLVRPTGDRVVWDCQPAFTSQREAVEWLEQVEGLAVDVAAEDST